ncbi:MAG: hypothetical protein JWM25_94 [Thermoleophilia bacterium]|nr:hypothetical protein [Thermoleophilia bacterium]MCZ4495511.1 hypothetical protein [Thermoleophilia bacterium]
MKLAAGHAPATAPVGFTAPPVADPIAWMLVEQRGMQGFDGDRYALTTIELEPWVRSLATLIDGRMTYPSDGGTTEFWYESSEHLLRPGVDPIAALEAAQRGVAALTSSVERASADLERFRVEQNGRLPRDPDTFEIWLRRESGAKARFIVPRADTPASVRDAQAAAVALAATMRANYDRLDPL